MLNIEIKCGNARLWPIPMIIKTAMLVDVLVIYGGRVEKQQGYTGSQWCTADHSEATVLLSIVPFLDFMPPFVHIIIFCTYYVMRQSACLVFNPIMVDNYAAFFNCTPVGRASDSMMAPT